MTAIVFDHGTDGMDEPDDDIFAAIDRAVRSGPAKGSLAREIKQNFSGYQKRFDGHQNDWTVIAARGFRDKKGNPASATTVRKIYERVRREQRAGTSPPQLLSRPVARPVLSNDRAGSDDEVPRLPDTIADDDDRPTEPSSRFSLRPATSRFKPKKED